MQVSFFVDTYHFIVYLWFLENNLIAETMRKSILTVLAATVLAAASRAYDIAHTHRTFSYVCKAPAETDNVTRILLRRKPLSVLVDGEPASDFSWDPATRTLFLRFPNCPDGVSVEIRW